MIKAIETRYAGHHFRSRLEARWAVFFNALGIPWEYEPQGYEVGPYPTHVTDNGLTLANTRYLPDFWLPAQKVFFEVKGIAPDSDYNDMLHAFTGQSEKDLILAVGSIPDPDTYEVSCEGTGDFWMDEFQGTAPCIDERTGAVLGCWDNYRAWCCCPSGRHYGIEFSGYGDRIPCGCSSGGRFSSDDDPSIREAYRAARSARFEHGQSG
ncbi:PDDEXK family nuclease [Streptacidiphilus sp. PAMC 29251]